MRGIPISSMIFETWVSNTAFSILHGRVRGIEALKNLVFTLVALVKAEAASGETV